MGLCKCPRKKVTTLFCFEHRVNVCEYCLVQKHSKCVVQSYLAWLQDSDYDPSCALCHRELRKPENTEVVRLSCLHLFHWPCFNRWALEHSENTAPAGYLCPYPECHTCVFPKPQDQGKISEELRQQLSKANWARAGLSLPLLPEFDTSNLDAFEVADLDRSTASAMNNSYDFSEYNGNGVQSQTWRREGTPLMGGSNSTKLQMDADENKYARRSIFEWLRRYMLLSGPARPRMSRTRRCILMGLFLTIALVIIFSVFSRRDSLLGGMGSSDDSYDPLLDPRANPNIRVAAAKKGAVNI